MDEKELARVADELHGEYAASGMGIDEFLRAKLGKERAEAAIRAFAAIDANYAELQEAKKAGENRREWLRRRLEGALEGVEAAGKRERAGEWLAGATDALNGAPQGTTAGVPFEGIDAADTVAALDEALAGNALATLAAAGRGRGTDGNGTEA